MNMFGFSPTIFKYFNELFTEFIHKNSQSAKAEFVIPSSLKELIDNNIATVKVLSTTSQWFGVTYQQDRDSVKAQLSKLIREGKYPTNLWE